KMSVGKELRAAEHHARDGQQGKQPHHARRGRDRRREHLVLEEASEEGPAERLGVAGNHSLTVSRSDFAVSSVFSRTASFTNTCSSDSSCCSLRRRSPRSCATTLPSERMTTSVHICSTTSMTCELIRMVRPSSASERITERSIHVALTSSPENRSR